MSDFDDEEIYGDFYSLVAQSQVNELLAVDKQREQERESMRLLAEKNKQAAMTLMQIAGLKSQKELDQITAEKLDEDVKRSEEENRKRKAAENAKLQDQFPPPTITHS